MSGKFSTTATTFNSSTLHKQEELIREIAQQEFYLLFEDIKIEIETKIKSIDKQIIELRRQIHRLALNSNQQSLNDVMEKLEKVDAEMQLLRYQQQFQLRTSRARSFDKERKPIFRKDSLQNQDFATILGLQQDSRQVKSQKRILEVKELKAKPPLPPDTPKIVLPIDSRSDLSLSRESSKSRRNPVLDDGASIHRWLQENNNREETCFNEIIREEDIEESVFY